MTERVSRTKREDDYRHTSRAPRIEPRINGTTEQLLEDLERGLRIDEHDLDGSSQEQPEVFYEVAKRLAYAISRRDQAKTELKEIEARADAQIRHDAEVNSERVTEAGVKNQILMDKNVIRAQNELLAADLEVGQLTALKEAYEQRSYALTRLTDLYITRYRAEGERTAPNSARIREADAERARKEFREQHRNRR